MNYQLVETLKNRLKEGVVSFTYTKKDGSERTALGTTKHEEIENAGGNIPTGSSNYKVSEESTHYYDLNSNGWRSFRNENLVSIND